MLRDPTSILGGDALVFTCMLLVCLLGSHLIMKTKTTVLPESSVAIVAGVAFGLVLSRLPKQAPEDEPFWVFSPDVFFYILLPPIIFEAGYSLQRRLFLRNLGPILTYAVVGTLISTGVITAVLQVGGRLGWVSPHLFGNITSPEGVHGSLLFASLISAVDPVATLAVLSSPEVNADATLQSILFGESVLNDAVAIVLYQTLGASGGALGAHPAELAELAGSFVTCSAGSTLIGLVVALSLSLLLRHGSLHEHSTHIEVALTLGAAYVAYALAEWLSLSGVLSLFFCGVALGHYNWYNLSDAAKLVTAHVTKSIAFLSETVVFAYLGLSASDPRVWQRCDWGFVGLTLGGCVLGRILNVFPLSALLNACRPPASRLPLRMQLVMSFAGLRGAIAFALALTFPEPSNRDVVSSTILTVLSSTLVLGGLTAPLVRAVNVSKGAADADTPADRAYGVPPPLGSQTRATSAASSASLPGGSTGGVAGARSSDERLTREVPHAPPPLLPSESTTRQPLLATADCPAERPLAVPATHRRGWLHRWWRRLDRRYLQHWFGGPASARKRQLAPPPPFGLAGGASSGRLTGRRASRRQPGSAVDGGGGSGTDDRQLGRRGMGRMLTTDSSFGGGSGNGGSGGNGGSALSSACSWPWGSAVLSSAREGSAAHGASDQRARGEGHGSASLHRSETMEAAVDGGQASCEEPHAGGERPADDSDSGEADEDSEIEAEIDVADEILFLVRAGSHDRFLLPLQSAARARSFRQ